MSRRFKQVIGDLIDAMQEHPCFSKVKRVYLFGSRARGDVQSRSDIDLAIIAPGLTHTECLQLIEIVDAANTLLKIDIVSFDNASNLSTHSKVFC